MLEKIFPSLGAAAEIIEQENILVVLEKAQVANTVEEAKAHLQDANNMIDAYNLSYSIKVEDINIEISDAIKAAENRVNELSKQKELYNLAKGAVDKHYSSGEAVLNKELEEVNQINKEIGELNATTSATNQAMASVGSVLRSSELKIVQNITDRVDEGYDVIVHGANNVLFGTSNTDYLEKWAKDTFGPVVFDACSVIKNGASDVMAGVDDLMSLRSTFGGSWRNPQQAIKKIQLGVSTIKSAATSVYNVVNDVRGRMGLDKIDLSKTRAWEFSTTLSGLTTGGIGVFNNIRSGNFEGAISKVGDMVSIGMNQRKQNIERKKEDLSEHKEKIIQKMLEDYKVDPNKSMEEIASKYTSDIIAKVKAIVETII